MPKPTRAVDHRRRRSGRAPAIAAVAVAAEDDGEEHHINPFLEAAPSSSSSRRGSRKVASRAVWVEEAGAAEVVDSKGKLWLTTGVNRDGKLYYNVEEIGFLAERGALVLLDYEGETIGMEEIYRKIAGGKYGCSWDAFQAYKHLKLLGYIIGRYGVPWTVKRSHTYSVTDASTSVVETDQIQSLNRVGGASNDITKLLKEMCIDDMHPSFEVYLPNSKFKKTSPGDPSFLLCLLSNKPPSREELETVENKFEGIPLKFCHVDNGRVSFLSFNKAALPSLP
uniref:tRNA-splicing endonuclease subunit Sen54 N-terminal domain-containing protein n=1 Tax=Oryza glumipatula TaxID=40148 RepID=A0A0E0B4Z0_9ORYZ